MHIKRHRIALLSIACIVLFGCEANAGMSGIFPKLSSWWGKRAVGDTSYNNKGDSIEFSNELMGDENQTEDKKVGEGRLPGMCQVPQQPAVMRCEIGSGFLCVDTPPGGVDDDSVLIRGTIDRQGSVLASIRVAVQNEYTKKMTYVDTSNPRASGCWDGPSGDGSFCLDSKGRYSVAVPLQDIGPYTISVSASRLSGESVEKKVRSSKVVAPALDEKKISFDPDLKTTATIDARMVMVMVDLLGECKYCDFIGASTGGLTVTIDNDITDPKKDSKKISCSTTVEQGGQGRFVIGVPVDSGHNDLSIRVCNAAVKDRCPELQGIAFEVSGDVTSLNIISPPQSPSYSSDEYQTIPWRFTLGGGLSCVELQFNREEPREICVDLSGEFSVDLKPRVGINVATLSVADGMEQFAWTFGWGRIISPYAEGYESLDIDRALGISISQKTLGSVLVPFINNFLASDEFAPFVMNLVAKMMSGSEEEEKPADEAGTQVDIPGCDAGGGLGEFVISINGIPTFGNIALGDFSIADDKMNLSVTVDGVKAGIDVAPDKDGDGKGDKPPLPLIISFSKVKLDFTFTADIDESGNRLILISSPHDDCAYKGSDYCKHIPASLVPSNFTGNASPWGHFVWCDVDAADDSVKDVCRAFNSINVQTVAVKEAILDSINSLVYCDGSAFLTGMTKDYKRFPVSIGCVNVESCDGMISKILPRMTLPLGIMIGDDIAFSDQGFSLEMGLSAGDEAFFAETPDSFHIPGSGIAVAPDLTPESVRPPSLDGYDIGATVSLDAVNSILFAGMSHGDGVQVKGLLDFDIHEPFFNDIGFDFVKECDGFEPIPGVKETIPTLCYIRPRVIELLGSSLTTYGYFPAKQPLIMAIRGNRALGPRLAVSTADEVAVVPRSGGTDLGATSDPPTDTVIELQLGGLELSFYAIEIDAAKPLDDYGNMPILFDAAGKPVIHSMRPSDPNPWNGPIVSFDVSWLLGLEISDVEEDDESATGYAIKLRTLADRSRLVLTPIAGSNVTTIPARKIISNLADQLMTAIAQYSPKESAIAIPMPKELAFEESEGSIFSSLGLNRIVFGDDGIWLGFDHEKNVVEAKIRAIVEQILHFGGEERIFTLPETP